MNVLAFAPFARSHRSRVRTVRAFSRSRVQSADEARANPRRAAFLRATETWNAGTRERANARTRERCERENVV